MRIPVLSFAVLSLAGCAYVGDPLPPALKIPTPVNDLAARQVGPDLLVSFTIPDSTLEGLAIDSLGGVELKAGPVVSAPFNPEQWSATARRIETTSKMPGKVDTKLPAREWANQEIVIGVRLANLKNRVSAWSNFVTLQVVAPLAKPSQLRALATSGGVMIEWARTNPNQKQAWKVFRQSAEETEPVEMATVQEPKFLDIGATYDVAHRYKILATEGSAISEMSDPLEITPVDTFPPVAPQGLSALAGPTAAQLSWERNQEPDLALYRIYRSNSSAELALLAESTASANYRDPTVMAGQTYRYAISAVDRKGNESPKSQTVEIVIP